MATGDYCTAEEAKRRIWPDNVTPDTLNDTELANTISAASRGIDEYCGTRFYSTSSDENRYFTPEHSDRLWTGPLISVTTLYTDEDGDRTYEVTWAATDFELYPWNAALDTVNPSAYTEIRTTPIGRYGFPRAPRSTMVTGKFGWSASTPALVKEACILQVIKWHLRPRAPFGVLGPVEGGGGITIPVIDPDIKMMLTRFKVNFT